MPFRSASRLQILAGLLVALAYVAPVLVQVGAGLGHGAFHLAERATRQAVEQQRWAQALGLTHAGEAQEARGMAEPRSRQAGAVVPGAFVHSHGGGALHSHGGPVDGLLRAAADTEADWTAVPAGLDLVSAHVPVSTARALQAVPLPGWAHTVPRATPAVQPPPHTPPPRA